MRPWVARARPWTRSRSAPGVQRGGVLGVVLRRLADHVGLVQRRRAVVPPYVFGPEERERELRRGGQHRPVGAPAAGCTASPSRSPPSSAKYASIESYAEPWDVAREQRGCGRSSASRRTLSARRCVVCQRCGQSSFVWPSFPSESRVRRLRRVAGPRRPRLRRRPRSAACARSTSTATTGRPEWVLVERRRRRAALRPARRRHRRVRRDPPRPPRLRRPQRAVDRRRSRTSTTTRSAELYAHYGLGYSEEASASGLPAEEPDEPPLWSEAATEEWQAPAGEPEPDVAAPGVPGPALSEPPEAGDEPAPEVPGLPGPDLAVAGALTADVVAQDPLRGAPGPARPHAARRSDAGGTPRDRHGRPRHARLSAGLADLSAPAGEAPPAFSAPASAGAAAGVPAAAGPRDAARARHAAPARARGRGGGARARAVRGGAQAAGLTGGRAAGRLRVCSRAGPEIYDRLIGRYGPGLAVALCDFAGVAAGQRRLDVGCGPGALTAELVISVVTDRRRRDRSVAPRSPRHARRRHPAVESARRQRPRHCRSRTRASTMRWRSSW